MVSTVDTDTESAFETVRTSVRRHSLPTFTPERTPNIPDPEDLDGDHEDVIGLYDSDDGVATYVLADPGTGGRWLAMPAAASLSVESWQ